MSHLPHLGFARVALLAVLFLTPSLTGFAAEPIRSYDIPAGDAATTLKQAAKQGGVEIVFPAATVHGVQTTPVKGEFTIREAINRMLAETDLVLVQDEKSGALTVNRLPAESKNVPSRLAEAQTADARSSARVEGGVVKLQEFEVFGSKLINADRPRSRDDVQPYVVFGREELDASNANNLEDFFRSRLPMNNASGATPANQFTPLNTSSVTLRGLSSNQTLILIDGRRAPLNPSGIFGPAQSDINGIPMSMIERIEILPATASGIYGGNATAGVINIITRKDFSGVELALSYTNTFDTDSAQRRADLSGSFSLEGGKTHLSFSAGFSDAKSMLVQDRDFHIRARELLLANNPTGITAAPNPLVGYTPNIRSQNGSNLILKPQYAVNGVTALGSPITHLPVGYAGLQASGAAPLLANAGTYNLDLGNVPNQGNLAPIGSRPEQRSLTLGARRKFGAKVEAYVDFSAQQHSTSVDFGLNNSTTILPVNAPNNPFTVPIIVAWPATNLVDVYSSFSRTRRATAGVIVKLPRDWTTGLDYQFSSSRYGVSQASNIVGDPDGPGPLPSFASALTNGTLDIMRDLNQFPLNYEPYRMPQASAPSRRGWEGVEWGARASGPLWDLPAGPMTLSTSVTLRDEKQLPVVSMSVAQVPYTYTYAPPAFLDARSAYAEMRIPVFPNESSSLLRAFELQAAARHDDYVMNVRSTAGNLSLPGPDGPFPSVDFSKRRMNAMSYTFGFKYAPLKDVALRASWSTGFLPPQLGQLSESAPTLFAPGFNVIDSKRSGVLGNTGPVTIVGMGSPDLRPETSESYSAGVIFTPRILPGFRFSIDYTNISKEDEIATLAGSQFFDYEDLLPGRIERAPLTPQDQALGYTGGQVTLVRTGPVNLSAKKVAAYDFQVDYERQTESWGRFHLYAIATYQQRLATQIAKNTPLFETIGYIGAIKWRANGGINWKRGPWSATWNTQYYDSYRGYSSNASPATIATFELNQGSSTIRYHVFHDVTLGYQFTGNTGWGRYLNRTRVLVGVQDVFNVGPRIMATTFTSGNRAGYGDPRMARYTLTLRKSF